MSMFNREKRRLKRITKEERKAELSAENHHTLKLIRNKLSKKGVAYLLSLFLSFSSLSSNAGVKDIIPKVKAVYAWVQKNPDAKPEVIAKKFREAIKDIDKELKEDIKNHNFYEADEIIVRYMNIAKALGDQKLALRLAMLRHDIQNEIHGLLVNDGIYKGGSSIYIVGKVVSQTQIAARQHALGLARIELAKKISSNSSKTNISIKNMRIVKFEMLNDKKTYKHIVQVDVEGDIPANIPYMPIK